MSTLAATNLKHASSASNNIVLDTSGNVGIGTSSPTARLQAYGTSGTTQARLGTANGYLEVNAFDANPVYCVVNGASHTAAVFGSQSNTPTVFFTNNTERMRVDSSGNVGIGTSSPGQKLDVNGVIQTNNDIYINNAIQYKVVGFYHSGTRKSYVAYDNTNNWLAITAEAASSSILFQTAAAPVAKIDSSANFQFNSGYGSVATAYGCRAWVYFNGTGTVAINGSGNVTSITDNGTGTYTVNFTTAMPDANYAVTGTCSNNDNNRNESGTLSYGSSGTYSTTAVQVWTVENTGGSTVDVDMPRISVAIFR